MDASRKFDQDTLYNLLPAVYRVRDVAEGQPLYALMGVIAEQVAILEEDLAQLYDDQFIETCADWVVPYIGDLLGVRGLHQIASQISPRAQVANALALRRRKGTAAMIEQLARDVTRWDAKAIEYFQQISTTQYLSHLRPQNHTVDLRNGKALQNINSAFDTLPHTAEIRSGGKYNLPNLGIFLWRVQPFSLTTVSPFSVDAQRYLFNPLGINTKLYNLPETEETITHLAERNNVPAPIALRHTTVALYYGEGKSIAIYVESDNGQDTIRELIPIDEIRFCNLADHNGTWANLPDEHYAIDPILGRLALPEPLPADSHLRVTFHYGFLADIGGGEYARNVTTPQDTVLVKATSIQQGFDDLGSQSGIIEVTGETFEEDLTIRLSAGQQIVLRSAENQRAFWKLSENLIIEGGDGASLTLDGLSIDGGRIADGLLADEGKLVIRGTIAELNIQDCTLVPGIRLNIDGSPLQPQTPSIVIESPQTSLKVSDSIVGAVRAGIDCQIEFKNSMIDATSPSSVAYAALDDFDPGGKFSSTNCTIIGKIHTTEIELASNTIFYAELVNGDTWLAPVWAERRQRGCVRFSYVPLTSRVPQRYQCHPIGADDLAYPHFRSLRYGSPFYAQLTPQCHPAIAQGADDEAEMGAFHDLFQPQRLTNLRTRLLEFMPFGMEPVILLAS